MTSMRKGKEDIRCGNQTSVLDSIDRAVDCRCICFFSRSRESERVVGIGVWVNVGVMLNAVNVYPDQDALGSSPPFRFVLNAFRGHHFPQDVPCHEVTDAHALSDGGI